MELYRLMLKRGYPEPFCDEITKNLNTDWTARRMIGYMSLALEDMLSGYRDYYRISDFNTAALLIQTSLEAVIHEMVFYPNDYDKEVVLRELTDMFCAYLLKPEYQGQTEGNCNAHCF